MVSPEIVIRVTAKIVSIIKLLCGLVLKLMVSPVPGICAGFQLAVFLHIPLDEPVQVILPALEADRKKFKKQINRQYLQIVEIVFMAIKIKGLNKISWQ